MSRAGRPWYKWEPARWRADPAVRMCGLAARGLWRELLDIADEADPRGYVRINNTVPTESKLSHIIGVSGEELHLAMQELESNFVFSRAKSDGAIFCRSMVIETGKREKKRKAGRAGGLKRAAQANAQAELKQESESCAQARSTSLSTSSSLRGSVRGKLEAILKSYTDAMLSCHGHAIALPPSADNLAISKKVLGAADGDLDRATALVRAYVSLPDEQLRRAAWPWKWAADRMSQAAAALGKPQPSASVARQRGCRDCEDVTCLARTDASKPCPRAEVAA